ncbi:acyltransferase [Pseudoduganella lutea]|uniref:Acyltransferase n=2 Tax=Pseudoduganella lutea TaxID=321985 RepID=A0A4P6L6M3_9BURK|nr:acyltransferase [Pseudoduganella lutea]
MRALAVIGVLVFHAFPGALRGGFTGVDIFFVISGFLITRIVAGEIAAGHFSIAAFYGRRIQRIFPALVLVMVACIAFGWLALFPDELKMLGKHVFGGTAFLSNIFLWQEVGYFDTAAETKPLLHLWSLGIEEQFYVLWPLALLWSARRGKALACAAVLAVLSFAVNVGGLHAFPSATFYSPASRAWELLAGALLACAALGQHPAATAGLAGRLLHRYRHPASVLGLLLVALAYGLASKERAFPGWWALLPVAGAVLLIGAGPQACVNRVLGSRPLVAIGIVSYPLYLWHWPLLSFAQIVESGTPSAGLRAAALALALLLAWATWRLVERPLRTWRTPRARVALLSAAMLALAAGGALLYLKDGLPRRAAIATSERMQKALVLVEDVANAAACKQRYGFDTLYKYCLQTWPDRAPTVALVGDSHAYHVNAGLQAWYGSRGENMVMFGTRIPYWGLDPSIGDEYQAVTQRMLELALETPSIHTVLLSTAAKLSDGNTVHIAALRETLRRYTQAGKQVIWLHDVPALDFDPRSCIPRAGIPSSKTRRDCSIARANFERGTADHERLMRAILADFPMVQQFRPAEYLCDRQRCHVAAGGTLMYRDNNHLSYEGDLRVGAGFAAEQEARLHRTTTK